MAATPHNRFQVLKPFLKQAARIAILLVIVQLTVPFLGGCGKKPEAQAPVAVQVQGAPIDAPAATAKQEMPAPPSAEEAKAINEEAKATELANVHAASDAATTPPQQVADAAAPAVTDPAAPAPLSAPIAAGAPVMLSEAEMAALAKRPEDKEGFLPLTFADVAGFIYKYPELEEATVEPVKEGAETPTGPTPTSTPLPGADERIPKEIRDLSGRKISMQGFMIPTDVQKGRIKSFVLIRNQMGCCFGVMPMMNEWMHVTMQGDTTCDFMPDVPLLVKGTLQVGEEVQEGIVVSIYRMIGEKVESTGPAPNQANGFSQQGF